MFFLPKKGPMAAVVFILRPQSQAFIKPLYCQMDNECFVVCLPIIRPNGFVVCFLLPKIHAFRLTWPIRPMGPR